MTARLKQKTGNILLHMSAIQKVLLCLGVSVIVFLLIRTSHPDFVLAAAALWLAFSLTFIITSWIIFFTMPSNEIVKKANKEDGGRFFVMVITLISCFASMSTVLLLMLAADEPGSSKFTIIAVAIAGMIASWIMVHTIFTFHYAHLYYFEGADDTEDAEALEFPREKKPDYLDFAYFSFVIGMTFQVSDVEINSRLVRRTALLHSLLSFVLNTFVVALTINFIAGLRN